MRKLLLFAVLTLLVSSPSFAADQGQALAPTKDAAVSVQVESIDTPMCSATRSADAAVAALLFETPTAQPESCYPPECGSGAPPGCPTLPGCCKYKCCVC